MKIATFKIQVPDDVKKDDVFNFMRGRAWQGELVSLEDDPNQPPLKFMHCYMLVEFQARTPEEVKKIIEDIEINIQNVKAVTKAEIVKDNGAVGTL